jgi:hypothetical protein
MIFRVLERGNDKILRGGNNGIIELEFGAPLMKFLGGN